MGAEIDRLEVQVEAQATKANNQLDKLVTKLDRVSGALSGLNSGGLAGLSNGVAKFAQASAQLSNVKTADFTRLTKNIEKLSALNTQQIYGAASSMKTLSTAINSLGDVSANSQQVVEIANSISKLGGVNIQRAITNLPALAMAMKNLMVTLSSAPTVSNNIIQMTNSLATLASQGAKVGTAGNSLTNSINRIGTSMERTTKKTRSFSSIIGSFIGSIFCSTSSSLTVMFSALTIASNTNLLWILFSACGFKFSMNLFASIPVNWKYCWMFRPCIWIL